MSWICFGIKQQCPNLSKTPHLGRINSFLAVAFGHDSPFTILKTMYLKSTLAAFLQAKLWPTGTKHSTPCGKNRHDEDSARHLGLKLRYKSGKINRATEVRVQLGDD
jgi:hypothetical protein